jgi:hypothetical protein
MAEEAVAPQNGENIFLQSWNGRTQFLSPDSEKFYIRLFLPLVKNPSSINLNNPKVLQDIIQDIYDQNPREDGVDIFSSPEIIFGSYEGYEDRLISAFNRNDNIELSNGDSLDLSSIGRFNKETGFSGYIDGWVADKIMLLQNFAHDEGLGGYIELNDSAKFSIQFTAHLIENKVPKILQARQNNDSERQPNQPEQSTPPPVAPPANDTAATSTAATPPAAINVAVPAEATAVPQNEEDNNVHLPYEGAETLVFLLASQLDQEDRGKVLVENNQTKHFALQEIISALQAKQGETMSALFEKDDARQEALAKALQFSRSEKFLMDRNKVNDYRRFSAILEEDQARLVMRWMGWNPDNCKNLDESKKDILGEKIKKAEKKYKINPPEEVNIVSSVEDQVVSVKPNIFQRVLRIDPNKTANTQGLSDKPVAESAPAAQPPQSASVPANLSNTWDVADVVNVSEAMSRIKKTYGRPISDRIDRNSYRSFGLAGFTTLAAVGLVLATPVVGAIGLGAFAWGAAALAAKATVGLLGLGAAGKLLQASLRVFEGEKATTQRRLADAYDAKRQGILGELIQKEAQQYEDELRKELGLPSRLPAPENVATAAPAPAVATAQSAPEPVAVAAQPEPVVAVNFGLGDNTPYKFYEIDTANDLNFVKSSIDTKFNGAEVVSDVDLKLTYKSSFTDADLVRLGFSQQRTN